MSTYIEWCQETWNPVTGCTPISEGCKNCYAKRMANRLAGRYGYPKNNPFQVTFHPDRLNQPLRWKKPKRIFVCSMSDLFHKDVKKEWIDRIFHVMVRSPQHTYLLLTKRPERMRDYWMGEIPIHGAPKGYTVKKTGKTHSRILDHIWCGTTAENQQAADERIPVLLQIPAAVRFVSIEPMLSNIDLKLYDYAKSCNSHSIRHQFLNWVICGTESGPKRRPAKIEWIRDLKNQCIGEDVSFFLKQMEIDGKVVKMPELDGRIWNEYPEGKT